LAGTPIHSAEEAIRELIFNVPSTDVLFNQYRDAWQDVDSQEAPIIRQNNLISYVLSVIKSAEVLAVGEAAGPWGCRFSGIAFVGERQLVQASLPFTGQRSSCAEPKLTKRRKAPFVSASSTMFWKVMRQYHPRFLVWDAIPLHPHLPNDRLSVRTPTDSELHQFLPALDAIISIVKPQNTLAVGNSAYNSLLKLGHKSFRVRHPANGGFPEFAAGMALAFSVGNRS
jgi:uracil-DNA glycosylase